MYVTARNARALFYFFVAPPRRAAVTSRWEVVLGYPVRTTGYFSAARENMYAKTQVWFLHYNARPRSPGFAGSPLRHQATKGNQRAGGEWGKGGGGAAPGSLTRPVSARPAVARQTPAYFFRTTALHPTPDAARRPPSCHLALSSRGFMDVAARRARAWGTWGGNGHQGQGTSADGRVARKEQYAPQKQGRLRREDAPGC
jgi:hypothetical protein